MSPDTANFRQPTATPKLYAIGAIDDEVGLTRSACSLPSSVRFVRLRTAIVTDRLSRTEEAGVKRNPLLDRPLRDKAAARRASVAAGVNDPMPSRGPNEPASFSSGD